MSRMPGYTIRRTCKHTHAYMFAILCAANIARLTNTGDPNSSHGIESKILPSAREWALYSRFCSLSTHEYCCSTRSCGTRRRYVRS